MTLPSPHKACFCKHVASAARLAHFHLQELTSGLPVLSSLFFLLPLSSPHYLISIMITLCLADLRWCNYFWAADFTLAKHYILPSFWELPPLGLCLPLFPFFKGLNLVPNAFPSNSSMWVRGGVNEIDGEREFGNVPRWFGAPVCMTIRT